jgi:hypothetical protein
MATTETLVANIKKASNSVRSKWVKVNGCYDMQAFDGYHFAENPGDDGYTLTATKEEGRWLVFGEDHEPSELAALDIIATYSGKDGEEVELPYVEDGFKTLSHAKAWAEAFAEDFQEVWEESQDD